MPNHVHHGSVHVEQQRRACRAQACYRGAMPPVCCAMPGFKTRTSAHRAPRSPWRPPCASCGSRTPWSAAPSPRGHLVARCRVLRGPQRRRAARRQHREQQCAMFMPITSSVVSGVALPRGGTRAVTVERRWPARARRGLGVTSGVCSSTAPPRAPTPPRPCNATRTSGYGSPQPCDICRSENCRLHVGRDLSPWSAARPTWMPASLWRRAPF